MQHQLQWRSQNIGNNRTLEWPHRQQKVGSETSLGLWDNLWVLQISSLGEQACPSLWCSEDHESQISLTIFIISILTFALIQGNLDWENVYIRLVCRQVYGTLLIIYLGWLSPLLVAPTLIKCPGLYKKAEWTSPGEQVPFFLGLSFCASFYMSLEFLYRLPVMMDSNT